MTTVASPFMHLFILGASVLVAVAILKNVRPMLIALGASLALCVMHVTFLYESWQLQQRQAEREAAFRVGFIQVEDYRKAQALGLNNQRQYDEYLERNGQLPH